MTEPRRPWTWTLAFTLLALAYVYPIFLVLMNSFKNKIYIAPEGTVMWNGAPVNFTQLAQNLEDSKALTPTPELQLEPDPYARYVVVDSVLALIKRAEVGGLEPGDALQAGAGQQRREFGIGEHAAVKSGEQSQVVARREARKQRCALQLHAGLGPR